MPYAKRTCQMCGNSFFPPHDRAVAVRDGNNMTHCSQCRRVIAAGMDDEPTFESLHRHPPPPSPICQIVFDLETWGLDRGWGVTMVGSFLKFNGGVVTTNTICLRDYPSWKLGRRSDDKEFVSDIIDILKSGHVAYAHNGDFFDMRWLRTVALKYGLDMSRIRLVDPAQIARNKYRLGRNSLEAIADFLELPYKKYHLSPEVWRRALLDDSEKDWSELIRRCESDVILLNSVAGAVLKDAGMIDYSGSGFRR